MDWSTFVQQFIDRVLACLNNLKSQVALAGVDPKSIIVEEVNNEEGVNDLRYRVTGTRMGKTFVVYIELTSAGVIDGQMAVTITLYAAGNGQQMRTSYVTPAPVKYNDASALLTMLDNLSTVENLTLSELKTAIRAFLGV